MGTMREGGILSAIMPTTALRDYMDVLDAVRPGSPVFLSKDGRVRYAILDMDDYDRLVAERTLFSDLSRGRQTGESRGWVSASDVRSHFEDRSAHGH